MSIWPFKKHIATLGESGMLSGFTDWHSHILPGIDDGHKTIEESLETLAEFERLGVKRLWLTPHIMEDYPNTTSDLQRRFEELRLAWDGKLELRLASENMLDSIFEQRLEEKDFLPIGEHGNHLLIETSYFNPPMNMDSMIERIFKAGYYPVLAHPERYRYMDERDYKRYFEMGIVFQMNFISLLGGYGETARHKAEWLLKKGMIKLTGSDLHRLSVLHNFLDISPRKAESLAALMEVARNPSIQ